MANTKISALTAAGALAGTEAVPIVQSSATVRTTAQAIANLATASSVGINAMTDTWNAGGTTFTAVKMDVTNTASAAGSLLFDLQIASTSLFKVAKTGAMTVAGGTVTDTTPLFNITQTWNDAADTFDAAVINITATASATASRFLSLQLAGTAKAVILKSGSIETEGNVTSEGNLGVISTSEVVGAHNTSNLFNWATGAGAAGTRMVGDWGVNWTSQSAGAVGVFGGSIDTALYRATPKVLSFEASGTRGGAGGTFRTVATTPAAIGANQDNYNPGGSSRFQRWSSDASRDVTGLTFTAAQVDGQEHIIVNVGAQDIVLKHLVTSTAGNQFSNSTGADITLTANQSARAIYDSTTAKWRVHKVA